MVDLYEIFCIYSMSAACNVLLVICITLVQWPYIFEWRISLVQTLWNWKRRNIQNEMKKMQCFAIYKMARWKKLYRQWSCIGNWFNFVLIAAFEAYTHTHTHAVSRVYVAAAAAFSWHKKMPHDLLFCTSATIFNGLLYVAISCLLSFSLSLSRWSIPGDLYKYLIHT